LTVKLKNVDFKIFLLKQRKTQKSANFVCYYLKIYQRKQQAKLAL